MFDRFFCRLTAWNQAWQIMLCNQCIIGQNNQAANHCIFLRVIGPWKSSTNKIPIITESWQDYYTRGAIAMRNFPSKWCTNDWSNITWFLIETLSEELKPLFSVWFFDLYFSIIISLRWKFLTLAQAVLYHKWVLKMWFWKEQQKFQLSEFPAYHENYVNWPKIKEFQFQHHSTDEQLSINTLMEEVKPIVRRGENFNLRKCETLYHFRHLFQNSHTMIKIRHFSIE